MSDKHSRGLKLDRTNFSFTRPLGKSERLFTKGERKITRYMYLSENAERKRVIIDFAELFEC